MKRQGKPKFYSYSSIQLCISCYAGNGDKGNANITYGFSLHLASTKSHNSCSDIIALWGLRNRPPWLKTHSTGADVHGVQKTLSLSRTGFKHANCLLSLTRCQSIPASVPSSINWMNASYEATTVGREMWITYNAFVLSFIKVLKMSRLFRQDQDQDQDFFFKTKTKTKTFISRPRPRPRPFFMSSRRRETKTKVSRLHLWYKHALANISRSRYVAIATQPVPRLQIRQYCTTRGHPLPHPKLHPRVRAIV